MGTDAVIQDLDVLSPEEARAEAEAEIQHYFGISLKEFLRRARTGALPDHPVVPHLVLLTGAKVAKGR